jgi:hypothetical protein
MRAPRAAHVGQHEGAGAVGRLGLARRKAALPDGRRLLVARQAGDRDRRPNRAGGAPKARRSRPLRQRGARHAEQVAQPLVPARPASGSSSVRLALLASVRCAAPPVSLRHSQLRSCRKPACPARRRAHRRHVVEQPAHLGGREIGVEQQAGARCTAASWPASRSSAQKSAVRRSCQTMARASGSPVAGPRRPPSRAGW